MWPIVYYIGLECYFNTIICCFCEGRNAEGESVPTLGCENLFLRLAPLKVIPITEAVLPQNHCVQHTQLSKEHRYKQRMLEMTLV